MFHRIRIRQIRAVSIVLTMAIVGSLIQLASPAFGMSAASDCPLKIGKAYRAPSVATVYVITPECTKRPFFNPNVYLSHFQDWNEVTYVEQPEMDAVKDDTLNFMPWGSRRNFSNGSLVKVVSDPTVYLIANGKAHPISNENAFLSLGYTFDQIEDVSSDVLGKFSLESETIGHAQDVPMSFVFKYAKHPTVYILKQEQDQLVKSPIDSMDTVKALAREDRIAVLPETAAFVDANTSTSGTEESPLLIEATLAATTTAVTVDAAIPVVAEFVIPSLSSSRTIPITSLVATDDVGVTGYIVRTSSVKPGKNAAAWSATAPASFTFASSGVKTLYAWVKDAVGNVSNAKTATVTIDTALPKVTAFKMQATSTSLMVPINTLTVTDNIGVAGYLLTESSIAPSNTDSGWSATAPISFTFATPGTKVVYAWAKDTAGNISVSRSSTVKITAPPVADTTAPIVTAFTMPASASALTVAISSLTATDNIGVTGYFVSESNVAPSASVSGWVSAAPANYVFATAGAKTLYAWAKDAAGNISANQSASVSITVSPGDVTPPVISNVLVTSTSPNTISISWTTNEAATSKVSYGASTSYGSESSSSVLTQNHVMTLVGLTAGTAYHLRVTSSDAAGNTQSTGDFLVTTRNATPSDASMWVAVYHPMYQREDVPPNSVPWDHLTHLILGYLLPKTQGAGYTVGVPSEWYTGWNGFVTDSKAYIAAGHQAGKKVTCMLGGEGSNPGNIWNKATTSTQVMAFATNIRNLLQPLGYDGVDLDWEDNINYTGLVALAKALREVWPEAIITIPAMPDAEASKLTGAKDAVDAIMPMSYMSVAQWGGWSLPVPLSPLYHKGSNTYSIDDIYKEYQAAGIPASKFVMGVGGYGSMWGDSNNDSLAPIAPYSNTNLNQGAFGETGEMEGDNVVSQAWVNNMKANPNMTEGWDDIGKSSYWHSPSTNVQVDLPVWSSTNPVSLVFYETPRSMTEKLNYVTQNGIKGMMFWTLSQMLDGTSAPILETVKP